MLNLLLFLCDIIAGKTLNYLSANMVKISRRSKGSVPLLISRAEMMVVCQPRSVHVRLAGAKSRLAPALKPEERTGRALSMLKDVLEAVQGARRVSQGLSSELRLRSRYSGLLRAEGSPEGRRASSWGWRAWSLRPWYGWLP